MNPSTHPTSIPTLVNMENDDYYTEKIDNYETITDKSNLKFSLYPIQYMGIWKEYKKQLMSFWTAEEIDFSEDYNGWLTLDDDKKHVIKMMLAFFANSDGIVNLNIGSKLMNEITINEINYAYQFQMSMENIHAETYSIMLDNLIRDPAEKNHLLNAITTIPSIKKISDWALKWIDAEVPIGYRIVAFACVEGIFFSGAFATIYWLKKYAGSGNFMPGLCKSNEFISRDERFHCEFACEIYKLVINKLSEQEIHQIVREAVLIAKDFNDESLKCKLVGMNCEMMNQYIEYIADYWTVSLGYNKIYRVSNPFTFMDTIGMMQKTNFHESKPSEYQLLGDHGSKALNFASNDDF